MRGALRPFRARDPTGSNPAASPACSRVAWSTSTAADGRLRLEPRGHAHEDAGDHALPDRPDRHGCLAARDRRPRLQRVPHGAAQPADRVDERDRGANRALRIVLVSGRRAPDRHHRVADELLDRPAVARHDRARHLEVARLDRAHLLGVERLGKRGEVLEVDEQDRDSAPLGRPRRVISLDVGLGGSRVLDRPAAGDAEARAEADRRVAVRAGRGQVCAAGGAVACDLRVLVIARRTAHDRMPALGAVSLVYDLARPRCRR